MNTYKFDTFKEGKDFCENLMDKATPAKNFKNSLFKLQKFTIIKDFTVVLYYHIFQFFLGC